MEKYIELGSLIETNRKRLYSRNVLHCERCRRILEDRNSGTHRRGHQHMCSCAPTTTQAAPEILSWITSHRIQSSPPHLSPPTLKQLCSGTLAKTLFPLHHLDLAPDLVSLLEEEFLSNQSTLTSHSWTPDQPLPLTVDLIAESKSYLYLLHQIDSTALLSNPVFLQSKAYIRAGRFLALREWYPDKLIVSPLDVASVLASILIRNSLYFEMCSDESALIDFTPPLLVFDARGQLVSGKASLEDISATQALYRHHFREEFSFDLQVVAEMDVAPLQPLPRPDGFYFSPESLKSSDGWHIGDYLHVSHVVQDRNWLTGFLAFVHQDSVPEFFKACSKSLVGYLSEYQRYLLKIKTFQPISELHMTPDADLMWHTHLLFSRRYQIDTHRLIGAQVNHLPWPENKQCSELYPDSDTHFP